MADAKISDLMATTAVADTDMVPLETAANVSKKITGANLRTTINDQQLASIVTIAGSGTTLPLTITDSSSNANSVKITPSANKSNSASVGGALYINNSSSVGVGLGVYTTQASPTGRLAFFRANNASFNQSVVRMESIGSGAVLDLAAQGTGTSLSVNHTSTATALAITNTSTGASLVVGNSNATPLTTTAQFTNAGGAAAATTLAHVVSIVQTGTGSDKSVALNVVSSNTAQSAMWLSGKELAHGTLKINHVGQADASDASGAALSIDLTVAGTSAKGIYVTSSDGGTLGCLLDIRNNGGSGYQFQVQPGQIILNAPASDPGTSKLWNGSWNAYLNEGGNTLVFKVKYSGGTIKSGTVALS